MHSQLSYTDFAVAPGHDCDDGAPSSSPDEIEVVGRNYAIPQEVTEVMLCIRRPDVLLAGSVALGPDVQLLALDVAPLGTLCVGGFVYTDAAQARGNVAVANECAEGQLDEGFELTLDATVPIRLSCGGAGDYHSEDAVANLHGTVAVAGRK